MRPDFERRWFFDVRFSGADSAFDFTIHIVVTSDREAMGGLNTTKHALQVTGRL